MTEIYINLRDVHCANYELPGVEDRAERIRRQMFLLKDEVPDEILNRHQIGQRFDTLCRNMKKWRDEVDELFEVTKSCMEYYAEAERKNEKNADALMQWFDSDMV